MLRKRKFATYAIIMLLGKIYRLSTWIINVTLPQMFMEIVECVGKYLCSMSKVSLSLNSFLWMSASSFPKRPLSFYWGAFSHRNDKMLLWKCVLLWWHNKNVFASHITHIYYLSLCILWRDIICIQKVNSHLSRIPLESQSTRNQNTKTYIWNMVLN